MDASSDEDVEERLVTCVSSLSESVSLKEGNETVVAVSVEKAVQKGCEDGTEEEYLVRSLEYLKDCSGAPHVT